MEDGVSELGTSAPGIDVASSDDGAARKAWTRGAERRPRPRAQDWLLAAVAGLLLSIACGGKSSIFHPVASDPHHDMSAAFLGDINGDGDSDIVASTLDYWSDGGGARSSVVFVCGRTGVTLARPFESDDHDLLCWSVHAAGDVNDDGVPDAACVLMDIDRRYSDGVRFFSGRDGALLAHWSPAETKSSFGASFARAGDLDFDGASDFLVGEPWSGTYGPAGRAVLVSGRTGKVIREHQGAGSDLMGKVVSALPDCDGDGVRDYAVAKESHLESKCIVTSVLHSGRDGRRLREHDGVAEMVGAHVHGKWGSSHGYALSTLDARTAWIELHDRRRDDPPVAPRAHDEDAARSHADSTAVVNAASTEQTQPIASRSPYLAAPVDASDGVALTHVIRWVCGTGIPNDWGRTHYGFAGERTKLDLTVDALWRSVMELGPQAFPVATAYADGSRVPRLAFVRRVESNRELIVARESGLEVFAELDPIGARR